MHKYPKYNICHTIYYRPQTKFVMFLHMSVILFTGLCLYSHVPSWGVGGGLFPGAFCIPQFPFAFEFKCEWLNMYTRHSNYHPAIHTQKYKYFLFWNVWPNCHSAVLNKKVLKFLNSWMTIWPYTSHSAICTQTQMQTESEAIKINLSKGSLSGVSVQEISVQEVSVQEGYVRETPDRDPRTVKSRRYPSYWNVFLLKLSSFSWMRFMFSHLFSVSHYDPACLPSLHFPSYAGFFWSHQLLHNVGPSAFWELLI